MTQAIKAVRATILLGDIELDVFQMPDGEYFLSLTQVAETIGINKKRLSQFRELNMAQTLYPEGFQESETIKIEGGTKPVQKISLTDVSKYWSLAAFQTQNTIAMTLQTNSIPIRKATTGAIAFLLPIHPSHIRIKLCQLNRINNMDKQNLVLRTCNKDGSSWDGFEWNLEIGGITTAPDWISNSECGNGLHGFLNGEGDGHLANWKTDAIWMVVEPIGEIVDLRDKVKFESATTHFVGNRIDATSYLIESIGHEYAVIGGVASTGDCGTATAGYRGTATAGVEGTATAGKYGTATAGCDGLATANDHGTAIAGMYGTATAGEHGTAIAGSYGIATAGCYGTATANDHGTAIAGAYGIATAGEHGRAIAGRYGTATVGCYGTATTGKYGTATAGRYGKATADCGSVITLNYWDGNRYRLAVGYIGEDGLLPNIAYKLDENHQFVVAL